MNNFYLALGSNIEPHIHIPLALKALRESFGGILKQSSTWLSEAVGTPGPAFWNLVVCVQSPLSAEKLKFEKLRPLEAALGRVRTEDKNAARTLDIDILIQNNTVLEEDIFLQAHLALPLAELLPDLQKPNSALLLLEIASKLQSNTRITRLTPPQS